MIMITPSEVIALKNRVARGEPLSLEDRRILVSAVNTWAQHQVFSGGLAEKDGVTYLELVCGPEVAAPEPTSDRIAPARLV